MAQLKFSAALILFYCCHTTIVVFVLMPLCTRTRYHSVSFERVRFIQRPALESRNNSEPLFFFLSFYMPFQEKRVMYCCNVGTFAIPGPSYTAE